MENQQAEPKGEEYPSYVADKRLIGLLPMFILVLIIVLRISWTLYKSFGDSSEDYSNEQKEAHDPASLSQMAFWYMIILIGMLLTWLFMFFCLRIIAMRQKTRSPQQRRMYVGSRARPSLAQQEPSIYVSPSNLPPPPKYECMAPPSYDEVVGVHYPNYQVQPITSPITTALAQTSSDSTQTRTETRSNDTATGTAVTRTADETIVNVPRAIAASS